MLSTVSQDFHSPMICRFWCVAETVGERYVVERCDAPARGQYCRDHLWLDPDVVAAEREYDRLVRQER